MRITAGQLRQIIREEAKRVLRENAAMSAQVLYDRVYWALRDMASGPDMLIDAVASEIEKILEIDMPGIRMPVEQLEAMLKSDEFYEEVGDLEYGMPFSYDPETRMVSFVDPMSF